WAGIQALEPAAHAGKRLAERLDALARAAERVAVLGVVGLEPSRAHAEHEAPVAGVVDRACHVGVQIGVAIGVACDERSQACALGRQGKPGQHRHALQVRAGDILARTALEEVIPGPERVGAGVLGRQCGPPYIAIGPVGRDRGADAQGVSHGRILAPMPGYARFSARRRGAISAEKRSRKARWSLAGLWNTRWRKPSSR